MFDQRFVHETQNLKKLVKKFWDSGGVRVGRGWVKVGVLGGGFLVLEWVIFVWRGGGGQHPIIYYLLICVKYCRAN